jgi:anaerobic magnesium-protoporphyrin IX monomethyl ester cyclase
MQAKTICFVIPGDPRSWSKQVPIDVVTASAILEARGHQAVVWDRRVDTGAPNCGVDIVAVSTAIADQAQCYPLSLRAAAEAAADATRRFPGAPTFAFGPHATHLPSDTKALLGVDFVSRGEPESAAVAGVEAILSGRQAARAQCEERVCSTIPAKDLPPASLTLLQLSAYVAEVCENGALRPGPSGLILAARGCPYQCTFCHLPFGTKVRTRNLETVFAEMDSFVNAGIHHLFILDYVFGIDRDFYLKFCDGLRLRGARWLAQTRPEIVLREDVGYWRHAGCEGIWLGAESLDVAGAGVRKPLNARRIEAAIDKLRVNGIKPILFILLGLPNETHQSVEKLARWLSDLRVDFGVSQMTLRPGTHLFDEFARSSGDGQSPPTWQGVERLNAEYRRRLPLDLDGWDRALGRLPTHILNRVHSPSE